MCPKLGRKAKGTGVVSSARFRCLVWSVGESKGSGSHEITQGARLNLLRKSFYFDQRPLYPPPFALDTGYSAFIRPFCPAVGVLLIQ